MKEYSVITNQIENYINIQISSNIQFLSIYLIKKFLIENKTKIQEILKCNNNNTLNLVLDWIKKPIEIEICNYIDNYNITRYCYDHGERILNLTRIETKEDVINYFEQFNHIEIKIEISFYKEKEIVIPFKKKEYKSKDTDISENEPPLKGIYYEFQDGELVHEDEVTEELLSGYSPFTWKIVEYN